MKTVILAIAFLGFAQCAKLDHLKYLPPDSRPANQESFDQGLAAPTTAQTQGLFTSGSQPQVDSVSVEAQPGSSAPGSFNADSLNAARLRGSPFITHGPQSTSGTFRGSVSAPQPEGRGFNEPQGTNEPSVTSTTFRSIYQSPQSDAQAAGPQSTNYYQQPSTFRNPLQSSQTGVGSQDTNPQQGSYGTQDSQTGLSANVQPSGSYDSSRVQGSTFEEPASSSAFPGAIGSGASVSHGSPFAQSSPAISNFKPQTSSGEFGSGTQPTEGFASNAPYQPTQTSSIVSAQQQGPQSSAGSSETSGPFKATYSQTNQGPQSFGPGKSTGIFSEGPSTTNQAKYQPSPLNQIPIIRLDTKNYGDGTYSTAYETGNGIQAEEQGQTQGDNSIAQGSFSYTSPEGEKVGLTYTADEEGYHPQGEHLPTPPPVPEAILKSIEYNKAHPEEENDDGSYKEPSSNDLNGQNRSPYSKSQYPGTSNKYLAPTSISGVNSQFSGSSSPFNRGSTTDSATGSGPVQSEQASFPASSYPSSSVRSEPQDNGAFSVTTPVSSNYGGQSSQPNVNKQSSAPSSYQYKTSPSFAGTSGSNEVSPSSSAPSSYQYKTSPSFASAFGSNEASPSSSAPSSYQFNASPSVGSTSGSSRAFPSSSFGGFKGSNTFQSAPVNQPAQKSSFVSQSTFKGPSGQKSVSFIGQDSTAPQGNFNSQNTNVIESSTPEATNVGSYGPSGVVVSQTPNAPQRVPSNQFSSQTSYTPSAELATQYGGSSSPSSSSAIPSQSYQNINSGPANGPGAAQNTESARFATQSANVGTKQYPSLARPQGQQGIQGSFSSGPSGAKPTRFGGYQYNAPSATFRNPGSSTSQQGGLVDSKPSPSGNAQGSQGFLPGNKFSTTSEPSGTGGEFGPEVFSHTSPVKTPGIQPQDENGAYLY